MSCRVSCRRVSFLLTHTGTVRCGNYTCLCGEGVLRQPLRPRRRRPLHFSLGKATTTAANAAAAAAAVTLTAATHAADNAVSLTTDYAIATIAISASAAAPIAITIASIAATTA